MLTISYDETSLTAPYSTDMHEIHQFVYGLVTEGKHEEKRNFIFDSLPIDPLASVALFTIRAPSLPEALQKSRKSLSIEANARLSIRCHVAASKRRKTPHGKVVEHSVPVSEMDAWFSELLIRHGMSAEKVQILDTNKLLVHRPDNDFFIPSVRFGADVTITNNALFTKAFQNGIGKRRAYGLGLVEVTHVHQG